MTLVVVALGIVGTASIGAALCALALRGGSLALPGRSALVAGCAYPVGALAVAAWMHLLARLHVPATPIVATAPVALAALLAIGYLARRRANDRWRRALDAISARSRPSAERWIVRLLLAWLALRVVLLGIEIASRPPLPWEAWLYAAARGHVWQALGAPAVFVPEIAWWQSGGYLAALSMASAFTPALDAWTALSAGFDDTSIHAAWLAFWCSLVVIAFGAMRTAGASMLAALAAAALIATLPLPNAHAALGGTSALLVATYYAGAVTLAWRATSTRARGDVAIALAMIAGMALAGGPVAAVWVATLVPLALARVSHAVLPKAIAALIVAAAIGVVAVAQNRLFAPAGLQDVPVPGLAALFQHAFLLGNWHLLGYAAVACALLCAPTWRDTRWLPLTGVAALGVVAAVALCTTPAGYRLLGATGVIGQASLVFAPVLGLWTALVAHAAWRPSSVEASSGKDASATSIETAPAAHAPGTP